MANLVEDEDGVGECAPDLRGGQVPAPLGAAAQGPQEEEVRVAVPTAVLAGRRETVKTDRVATDFLCEAIFFSSPFRLILKLCQV